MKLYTHTHTHTGSLINKKSYILLSNNNIYNKKNLAKSTGITIISLIVTIIVLLILAGISIATLTSDNGIIKQSKSAKENTEISEEKEIIQKAVIGAIGTDKRGNLTYEELEKQLNQNKAETTIDDTGEEFEIVFKKSNRCYTVDQNGDIIDEQQLEKIDNPGDITKNNQCDGSEEKPYEISCIEDLVAFSNMTNGSGIIIKNGEPQEIKGAQNFKDKKIILTRTLNFKAKMSYVDSTRTDFGDINGDGTVESIKEELTKTDDGCVGFTPIRANYGATFDGQNNTIKNIYIHKKDGSAALFYTIGIVKNLKLTGTVINDTWEAAGIACYIKNIENCVNYANVTGFNFSGGVCAIMYGENIENCTNYGNITITGTSFQYGGAGGILAHADATKNIINCKNYGNISGNQEFVGGIAGLFGGKGDKVIESCLNYGKISLGNTWKGCGGIVASCAEGNFKIINSINYGDVNGCDSGGIIGNVVGQSWDTEVLNVSIINCANIGNINTIRGSSGGIVGTQATTSKMCHITIKNSYNIGKITGVSAGSIIGAISYSSSTDTKTIFENVYYISDPVVNKGTLTSGEATYKSLDEIQSQTFVDLLNKNIEESKEYKKWTIGKSGYPEINF